MHDFLNMAVRAALMRKHAEDIPELRSGETGLGRPMQVPTEVSQLTPNDRWQLSKQKALVPAGPSRSLPVDSPKPFSAETWRMHGRIPPSTPNGGVLAMLRRNPRLSLGLLAAGAAGAGAGIGSGRRTPQPPTPQPEQAAPELPAPVAPQRPTPSAAPRVVLRDKINGLAKNLFARLQERYKRPYEG